MQAYNETENFSVGEQLMQKWEKALNADGGIRDNHKALTTAILLENYMTYLQKDKQLIMEDQVDSTAFKGVNLALLGLIRRVVPSFVGGDLVGVQAMPTPRSPIFYLWWKKDVTGNANQYAPTSKGASLDNDELFGYPASQSGPLGLADPHFSSSRVVADVMSGTFAASQNPAGTFLIKWRPVVNSSVYVSAYSTAGVELARIYFPGAYSGGVVAGVVVAIPGAVANFFDAANCSYNSGTFTITIATGAYVLDPGVTLADVKANWEYNQEANKDKPQLTLEMKEELVTLIRRELRGKFTLDSMTDAKAYWGINLENEMIEIMKLELMNEINREIVEDLRAMAAITATIDYTTLFPPNRNYDDTHKIILDTIDNLCAEIWNQGRLGRGNFVVGNPSTLAFLDRVPGFVGSGVNYDGKTLVFAGQLGNRINFYYDPQYRKNELLIGYKGPSAIDSGYIYAPYLPITPTPTLYDPETGDPRKIFYTRYGKTFEQFDPNNSGLTKNKIFRGEYQYARLTLKNFPQLI